MTASLPQYSPPMKTLITGHAVPQTDPPRSPRETLPTMYDLPSETVGEPGLPDEYHDLQPQLLSRTLALRDYSRDDWFTGSDLNLYYDVERPLWYKRPDWFLAVGVPRLYDGQEFRRSYVVWQERQAPSVAVEFLSPGTEAEDLGRFHGAGDGVALPTRASSDGEDRPPSKFWVYEHYLRIPHYVVYSRHTRQLRYFQLEGGQYQEQRIQDRNPRIWLPKLKIGLGLWQGIFEGIPSHWLRWCDESGYFLPTDTEQERQAKEQERQAKEQERQAKEQAQAQVLQAARNLIATGMTQEQVTSLLGLSPEQVTLL